MARTPKKINPKRPGSLLIRNVPGDILSSLDDWIKELTTADQHGATYSRMGLALQLIKEGLERKERLAHKEDLERKQAGTKTTPLEIKPTTKEKPKTLARGKHKASK